jgi:hypothetical protein
MSFMMSEWFHDMLKMTWKIYDNNWCMSVLKDGHDDYMVWKHKHRTKSWAQNVRQFGIPLAAQV